MKNNNKVKDLNLEIEIPTNKFNPTEIQSELNRSILDVYGIKNHVVQTKNVKIDNTFSNFGVPKNFSKHIISYKFKGEPDKESTWNSLENVHDRLQFSQWVNGGSIPNYSRKDHDNLSHIYTGIYNAILADKTAQEKRDEWEFVKFYFMNKVRKLFNIKQYDDFWAFNSVIQKVSKIKETNRKHAKYIKRYLNRTRYNLYNFNFANDQYMKIFKENKTKS